MRKLRKVLCVLTTAALVMASLTGCGRDNAATESGSTVNSGEDKKETETKPDTETKAEPETKPEAENPEELVAEEGAKLVLWTEKKEYNEAIQAAWQAAYPDIPLEFATIGGGDAEKKLELDGPNGIGCDVFVQPHDHLVSCANSGNILEIDYYSDYIKEAFEESTLTAVTYDGMIYGFPLSIKTPAMFYNKALVSEPVKTFDELKEFAKSYNDPTNNKFACLWQACEGYWGHPFLSGYGYQLFGPDHNDKNLVNWDTKEALEGMEFYNTLTDIYPVKSTDASWDAMTTMFSEGNAPYVFTGAWDINRFDEAGVDFGVTSWPLLPNGEHPVTFSTVDTICISSYTKYPNASMILAEFMTQPEQYKLLYENKHEIPAIKGGADYDYIKADAKLSGAAQQIPYTEPMPCIPEMTTLWDPYAKAFTAVWDKTLTPEEALKKAIDEFALALEMKE